MRRPSPRGIRGIALVAGLLLASCGLATLGTSTESAPEEVDGAPPPSDTSEPPPPSPDAASPRDAANDRSIDAAPDAEGDSGTACDLVVTGASVTITSGGTPFSPTVAATLPEGTYTVVRGFNAGGVATTHPTVQGGVVIDGSKYALALAFGGSTDATYREKGTLLVLAPGSATWTPSCSDVSPLPHDVPFGFSLDGGADGGTTLYLELEIGGTKASFEFHRIL